MSYTLAIEPSTPAWIAPQRMLLTVHGEQITDVEYRPEHSGAALVERLNSQTPALAAQHLGRSCPTCGIAHALAYCIALESLTLAPPPPRALVARCILAELERAASHLATLEAIFTTIGLWPIAARFQAIQSGVYTALRSLTHSDPPALMLTPGGLTHDLHEPQSLGERLAPLQRELYQLADGLIDRRRLANRMVEVGVITTAAAEQFQLRGPLARSAGLRLDARIDTPYAAYATYAPEIIVQEGGDVYARMVVLLLEALEALKLVARALGDLPEGAWATPFAATLPVGEALGSVEAPRGAFHCRVSSNGRKVQVEALEPAPQLNRLLARALLIQAELDQTALIAISTDPCSGCLAVASTAYPG